MPVYQLDIDVMSSPLITDKNLFFFLSFFQYRNWLMAILLTGLLYRRCARANDYFIDLNKYDLINLDFNLIKWHSSALEEIMVSAIQNCDYYLQNDSIFLDSDTIEIFKILM